MIALNLAPEARWIDLMPGVRARVRPMSSALFLSAQQDDWTIEAAKDGDAAEFTVALTKAVAVRAVLEWDGVGDLDGQPLAPSREAVSALLDLRAPFEAFQAEFMAPWMVLAAEKKGFAPLPDGILAGAPNTAATAPNNAPNANTGCTSL